MENKEEKLINYLSDAIDSTIKYQFADKKGYSLFAEGGEKIISEDILGNYTAEFSFAIAYRSKPAKASDRINACNKVDDIGKWLENQESYFEDSVTELKQVTNTMLVFRSDDGTEDYQADFKMIYKGVN